jgi:predicted amidophosphoribosyltransferase
VHEVKFTRWRRLGHDLGRLLGDALAAQMRAAGLAAGAKVLLVPMPTTFWRRFARGIDHTLVLARGAAPRVGARIARPIRRAHRPSQTTVAPSARGANVAGAFGLRRACTRRWGTLLREAELVIVLDDVATTGSTLRGAVRAVREAIREARGPGWATYPLIWAAVVAKTPAGHHDGDEIGAA